MSYHRVILSAIVALGLGYGLMCLTLLPGSDEERLTTLGVGARQEEQAPGDYGGAFSEPARLRELRGVSREESAPEPGMESPVFPDLLEGAFGAKPAHLGEPINADNGEAWGRFQPRTDPLHVGSEIDADEPRDNAHDGPSRTPRNIGPLLDVDMPPAGVFPLNAESSIHIGPRLDADDL